MSFKLWPEHTEVIWLDINVHHSIYVFQIDTLMYFSL